MAQAREASGNTPVGNDSHGNGGGASGDPGAPAGSLHRLRPLRRSGPVAYPVADEMVLLPGGEEQVITLNRSGRAIWELCDGEHSLHQMLEVLRSRFTGNSDLEIMADITSALFQLRALDLLEESSLVQSGAVQAGTGAPFSAATGRRRVQIVHGVEDTTYFHWQLAILFESLVGQMPAGWEVNVVVCNNHRPISDELRKILDTYGVRHFTGESHADNHHIDFAGGGDRYVPLNRVEALNVISRQVASEDLVVLMDTDIFLYGELQAELFPRGNAMASNWIIGQERYFHFATKDHQKGLSLPKLLDALGCESEFKPGGVMVFLLGSTLKADDRKVVRDAFRFLQILYLMGKILDLPPHGVWVAEMACFAMAMYPNGHEYELLDIDQFAVQEQGADDLPDGTFFHYYTDINDGSAGPFAGSQWHKQLYRDQSFLRSDVESFLADAQGAAERRFMTLAKQARERLYG